MPRKLPSDRRMFVVVVALALYGNSLRPQQPCLAVSTSEVSCAKLFLSFGDQYLTFRTSELAPDTRRDELERLVEPYGAKVEVRVMTGQSTSVLPGGSIGLHTV